jgi:excisionase family DNA binding protein
MKGNFCMKLFMNDDVAEVESLVVDVRTAAKMLGVCERTVRNLTKRGELPVIRIAGCVRYSVEDLKEFVRQQSRRETADCTPG